MSLSDLPAAWNDMRLDPRIKEAIASLHWRSPTLVQRACIPPLLLGHDVSVQSRTGSGKTGAYVLPLIQRLVVERASKGHGSLGLVGLILAPSVELCAQTTAVLLDVGRHLKPRAIVENLCDTVNANEALCASGVNFVVSTPAVLAQILRNRSAAAEVIEKVRVLVIDEADLLVSATSLFIVESFLPKTGLQTVLLSATLTNSVANIRSRLLRSPMNITLTEEYSNAPGSAEAGTQLEARTLVRGSNLKQHYLVATDECNEYTLLYALFRLHLIQGKTLIFVDDETETYKLQHFLELLGVTSVVYDCQLPLNVRMELLRQFQNDKVVTMICTDGTLEHAERAQLDVTHDAEPESALHRGIDFHHVQNVIVFDGIDEPTELNFSKYTHRIGRAGRMDLGASFVFLRLRQARQVLTPLREYVRARGENVRPFKKLDRSKASQLQYRVETALTKVTRTATRRLRIATVASELATSKAIAARLETVDTEALRSIVSKNAKAVRVDPSLLEVPEYMNLDAEAPSTFKARVNAAKAPFSRQQHFSAAIKRKREDPIYRTASKLRKKER